MAGYWAYYPGRHAPELDPLDTEGYAILDGPEIDPADPPAMPVAGTASYVGLAGGNYSYVPGATLGQRRFVFDSWVVNWCQASPLAQFGLGVQVVDAD